MSSCSSSRSYGERSAPPEAADDDCVFVKVTTLAERDAIGRANAIVLD